MDSRTEYSGDMATCISSHVTSTKSVPAGQLCLVKKVCLYYAYAYLTVTHDRFRALPALHNISGCVTRDNGRCRAYSDIWISRKPKHLVIFPKICPTLLGNLVNLLAADPEAMRFGNEKISGCFKYSLSDSGGGGCGGYDAVFPSISTVPSKSPLRHMQDFGLHSLDVKTCDWRWNGGDRCSVLTEVVWVDPEACSADDATSGDD
ncbi:hypothetical protein IW261DRAFT_1596092 [Armillaria novae-zelandiae]|uniref:Uncharacterized protein n=1 Tax=Armillaria novae-zelandiae TaxID=153914 RepID=A0AA39NXU7_9AGAR|nr:hypothetical protein IW261DRAFT_1596092 [Armillaria novae-zelandiae]